MFYWNRALWVVNEDIENALYLEFPISNKFVIEYGKETSRHKWFLQYPDVHYINVKSINIDNSKFPNMITLINWSIEIESDKKIIKTKTYYELTKHWSGQSEFVESYKWEKQINYSGGVVKIYLLLRFRYMPNICSCITTVFATNIKGTNIITRICGMVEEDKDTIEE